MEEYKRYHIPAFGNWELSDGVPITQYFEDASKQGDLIRYTDYGMDDLDLYKNEFLMVTPTILHYTKTKGRSRHYQTGKEAKKKCKVCDVTGPPRPMHPKPYKAVDADLYKIPSDLLSRRGKAKGFFTRCFMPSCAA